MPITLSLGIGPAGRGIGSIWHREKPSTAITWRNIPPTQQHLWVWSTTSYCPTGTLGLSRVVMFQILSILVVSSMHVVHHYITILRPRQHWSLGPIIMCFTWASWVCPYLGFERYCSGLPVGAQLGLAHKPHYLKYIPNSSKQTPLWLFSEITI